MNNGKILIYLSDPICYGITNHFARKMGEALTRLGEEVEYFDLSIEDHSHLLDKLGNKYKAIFGVQSPLFSVKYNDGRILHNYFDAPQFNMVLDHPCIMHKHLINSPQGLTILTHDRNYKSFIEKYYGNGIKAEIIPPAGDAVPENELPKKEYDLIFIGSLIDWKPYVKDAIQMNRWTMGFARKLIHELKTHPNNTYEECFERIVDSALPGLSILEKKELFHVAKCTYLAVSHFSRLQIIREIVRSGQELHVYGDSWKRSEFVNYDNVIIHEALSPEEIPYEIAKTRISLNIMTWHKDGMTERIATTMMNGTLCLSDRSTYLEEHFTDGEEIVLFDLEKVNELPGKIKELLDDSNRISYIANMGREKSLFEDTWDNRARGLLELIG